ncbi:hypothetical protein N7472_009573 [Penicillium cf. griseofulvum]|uniref:Serine aminopeptidase S33 domain-containing protein n=1 Tax=Penicillium cf. griseofulvum TaxID=2972120 RepID=A0A9W9M0M7_9EURO|nr:hypothetical protein N7472_009573 [Penicillium cf. griseofulvum]KAJ5435848.1 hypothetical protein N7445_006733 [Penicillium cf. griseofulvum]
MDSPRSFYYNTPNGTHLHCTENGNPSGSLVILLHGLGGSTETFQPLLQYLSPSKNRLISVDFEGFGKSAFSSPDVTLSIPRYVSDLEHLVSSFQGSAGLDHGGKLLLIGHSLGAIVSMHYASKAADQLRGLVLLGPGRSIANIPAARDRMLDLAKKTRAEGIQAAADTAAVSNFPLQREISSRLRQIVRDAVASCDAEAYAKTCEAVASFDHVDPDYSRINIPTLLLAGGDDVISPPERSVALAELIGDNSSVKVLEGVGHQMILQDLDGSVEAIKGFLLEKVGM